MKLGDVFTNSVSSPATDGGGDYQRSAMPPSGEPWDDRRFDSWADDFVRTWNVRILDGLPSDKWPAREPLTYFRLTGHLYKFLVGWQFPDGTGPNYSHRKRFVAIQYKLRPAEVVAEAESYARSIRDELAGS
jgi:hypothetical protein